MDGYEKADQYFNDELQMIRDPGVKTFTRYCLAMAPDYFWVVPSSSTGKYHPKQSNGVGGLVRHSKAVVMFSQRFSRAHALEGKENDILIAACLLHDIVKYGPGAMKKHTTKTHDRDGANYVHGLARSYAALEGDNPPVEKQCVMEICLCILHHTGRWTSHEHAKAFPSEYTTLEYLTHLSDMMSSAPDVMLESLQTPGIG